jgi:hypothetical protein
VGYKKMEEVIEGGGGHGSRWGGKHSLLLPHLPCSSSMQGIAQAKLCRCCSMCVDAPTQTGLLPWRAWHNTV